MFTVDYCDEVDTIVSGSADSTLRIWKMSSGQCLQTRYGHSDWVIKVLSTSSLLTMFCLKDVAEEDLLKTIVFSVKLSKARNIKKNLSD